MKRNYSLKDVNIKKFYLIKKPVQLSDLSYEELDDDTSYYGWREKSRRLQARRWRKIKHQLA